MCGRSTVPTPIAHRCVSCAYCARYLIENTIETRIYGATKEPGSRFAEPLHKGPDKPIEAHIGHGFSNLEQEVSPIQQFGSFDS